jgi:DNA-3-methyladenine glycosylase II
MTTTITLDAPGPFSLAASTRFLEGFAPAAHARSGHEPLRLAFAVEGTWEPAAVSVRATGGAGADGGVTASVAGTAPVADVRRQLARILSLDVDGAAFGDVGRRDEVVARLQTTYRGLRPVCFNSPYEAAAWAVIGQRIRIVQAAAVKARMAEEHGVGLSIDGTTIHAFPAPRALLDVAEVSGLNAVKIGRLHAVAEAALAGGLDGDRLRSLPVGEALRGLQEIPGIGPFSAELILVRGAGAPDVFPVHERRLHASMAERYHLDDPDVDELERVAARWSPFRSWVALLLRTEREDLTGEIGGARRRPPSGPA